MKKGYAQCTSISGRQYQLCNISERTGQCEVASSSRNTVEVDELVDVSWKVNIVTWLGYCSNFLGVSIAYVPKINSVKRNADNLSL